MKEENNHIDYLELSSKYLSGNATDAEVLQLEAWVLSAPANKQQFLALRQAWMLANTRQMDQSIDIDKEWDLAERQIFEKSKVVTLKPKRSLAMIWKTAAAVAILIVASLWFFRPAGIDAPMTVFSESEVKEQQLSDGTQIALNKYSTASYSFESDGSRQVALKGDAFFDVVRDTAHPFIINTQNVEVKVLGTSFYVDSRDEQNTVQVIVASGTVAMSVGIQEVILTKGEIGTYVKSSEQLTEQKNNDVNYMAWKTGRLVYDGERLEKVVYDLNRTFHAQISLANTDLNSCSLSATYEDKSLDAILRIIEKTLTLKATKNGEQIVISGTCE